MFGQQHQAFEVRATKMLARDAVTKEEPANNVSARMERHDDLSPKCVEGAAHQGALLLIGRFSEIASANDVGVQFEPPDQRIALAIFDLRRFGKAPQAGSQPIAVALPDLGKNTYAADSGGVGCALDHAGQQGLDVVKTTKDAGKTEQRQGARTVPEGSSTRAAVREDGRRVCSRSHDFLAASQSSNRALPC